MASEKMSLKLLVHKATQKVLYAEVPKEFVDFLVHLFSLPVGTMLHLVGSKQMAGCLACRNASLNPDTFCPTCRRFMTGHFNLINSPAPVVKEAQGKATGGFVKEVVTYMVMDNLVVKPLSTSSSITFMDSCGVKDLTQIEEKTLLVGEDEALELLKASLSTNAVLTTILHSRQVKEEYILD